MVTTHLLSKKLLTADIWSFVFEAPHDFEWHGGEHAVVVLDQPNHDDRGNARTLSIASLPFEKHLQFVTHVPERASSFKLALLNLETGGSIALTPAQNSFRVDFTTQSAVFVVGGIGIVPVRSLLIDHDHSGVTIKAKILYYAPSGQHLFRADFEGLTAKHPELSVEYVVAEGLQEQGAIKEVEQQVGATYYFSGVYTREMLAHEEIAQHVAAGSSAESRKEVEFLAKASGLL